MALGRRNAKASAYLHKHAEGLLWRAIAAEGLDANDFQVFTEEGLHRQAVVILGQRRDNVVYGLLADEWRAHRTSSRGNG
jgi:hypothetical protein